MLRKFKGKNRNLKSKADAWLGFYGLTEIIREVRLGTQTLK